VYAKFGFGDECGHTQSSVFALFIDNVLGLALSTKFVALALKVVAWL